MSDQPTQPTQPAEGEPVEIPVPTRGEFFGNLAKIAPPVAPPVAPSDEGPHGDLHPKGTPPEPRKGSV